MKLVAPDYYADFRCLAGACRHTCCEGWEIDVDEDRLADYRKNPFIAPHIDETDAPHFRLLDGERCPFLNQNGLCEMILRFGEASLCQICRDHPRFRNYWSDRTELGLGLVCEEAGRIILERQTPMRLIVLEDDGVIEETDEDEAELMALRGDMLGAIRETEPRARLMEYLIYRHLPDALYDGRLEARVAFIHRSFDAITAEWAKTDGSLNALVECARVWSYDTEYDDEVLEAQIAEND